MRAPLSLHAPRFREYAHDQRATSHAVEDHDFLGLEVTCQTDPLTGVHKCPGGCIGLQHRSRAFFFSSSVLSHEETNWSI